MVTPEFSKSNSVHWWGDSFIPIQLVSCPMTTAFFGVDQGCICNNQLHQSCHPTTECLQRYKKSAKKRSNKNNDKHLTKKTKQNKQTKAHYLSVLASCIWDVPLRNVDRRTIYFLQNLRKKNNFIQQIDLFFLVFPSFFLFFFFATNYNCVLERR